MKEELQNKTVSTRTLVGIFLKDWEKAGNRGKDLHWHMQMSPIRKTYAEIDKDSTIATMKP